MAILIVPTTSADLTTLAPLAEPYQRAGIGDRLWMVGDSLQASAIITGLSRGGPGMLDPGVKPLGQAAESLVAKTPRLHRPISKVQQHRLIADLVAGGARERKYPLLEAAIAGPGGVEFLATAFREFAHSQQSPAGARRAAQQSGDRLTEEIAGAFSEYRRQLTKHSLTDYEVRLAIACEAIERTDTPFPLPTVVYATGLLAPSLLETRFLVGLLSRASHAAIELDLPADSIDDVRADDGTPSPWSGPLRLIERLRSAGAEVGVLPSPSGTDPAHRYVQRRLFAGATAPADEDQAAAMARYRVSPANGAQQEAADVARRVKKLLLDGTRPERIVLASRRLADLAPRLKEEFAEVGVPLSVELPQTLADAPIIRTAALLLRLAMKDWRHDDLLSLVTLPQLTRLGGANLPEDQWLACQRLGFPTRRAALEWFLREQLYPKGRRELLRRTQWLSGEYQRLVGEADADAEDERADRRRLKLALGGRLSLEPLEAIAAQCDRLAEPAPPGAWYDRLTDALRELGYKSPDRAVAVDHAALIALEDAFTSLSKLDHWRGRSAGEFRLPDVDALLREWLPRVRLDLPWRHEGRVLAVTAETAAGLTPDHLFVIGLDEQSFPRAPTRGVLPEAGDRATIHQGDEMRLFIRLATRARVATRFSYPAVDSRAQLLNPSSYLDEFERLLPAGVLRETAERTDGPLSPGDALEQATRALLDRNTESFARLLASPTLAPTAECVAAALRCTYHRSHGDAFGVYDGILASEPALQLVQTRYGPQHHWSASQLETYADCPYKFFLRSVLRADPLESLALDVDYRRRGTLLHDAMVRFHRRLNEIAGDDQLVSQIDPQQFQAAFSEAVYSSLQAISTATHEEAVAEVEAMQAVAWRQVYQHQFARYEGANSGFDQPLRPTHFEARFGPRVATEETPDPLSTPEPFGLDLGDERLLLTGQIDRIDIGKVGGQTVYTVVDYKTASQLTISEDEITSGRLLQLVLYTIAVSDHLLADRDAAPLSTGYWMVQNAGFKTGSTPQPGRIAEGQVVQPEDWQELVSRVRDRVREIVTAIRAGAYPVFNPNDKCTSRCEYRTVCRIGQARAARKQPAAPTQAGG